MPKGGNETRGASVTSGSRCQGISDARDQIREKNKTEKRVSADMRVLGKVNVSWCSKLNYKIAAASVAAAAAAAVAAAATGSPWLKTDWCYIYAKPSFVKCPYRPLHAVHISFSATAIVLNLISRFHFSFFSRISPLLCPATRFSDPRPARINAFKLLMLINIGDT